MMNSTKRKVEKTDKLVYIGFLHIRIKYILGHIYM